MSISNSVQQIFFLVIFFTMTAGAENGHVCGEALQKSDKQNLAIDFAEAVSARNEDGEYTYLGHQVQLTAKKLSLVRPTENESVNEAYRQFMEQYTEGEGLARLREQSLTAALQRHGLTGNPGGRSLLKQKSEANRRRIEVANELVEVQDPQLIEILENIELKFIRRTNSPFILGAHLLSSQQIAKMDLPGGKNSTLAFNKTFLASDDGVFFFARFGLKNREIQDYFIGGQYGDITEFIKGAYARDHGWLSPFIMTEKHLAESQLEFQPNPLPPTTGEAIKEELMRVEYNPEAETIGRTYRLQLSEHDFTPADLESLYKKQLGKSLLAAKSQSGAFVSAPNEEESPYKVIFSDIEAALLGQPKADGTFATDNELYNLFYSLMEKPLGLKIRKFEFKVPVSVPVAEICRAKQPTAD